MNLISFPKAQSVRSWFYGHFHHSWHAEIEGIRYYMLDILELHTLQ